MYILFNLLLLASPASKSGIAKQYTLGCIFIELATNQLVMYMSGSLQSNATMYIIIVVAVYRVFFDYRYSLFAAIVGGTLFASNTWLEITGRVPIAPSFPLQGEHPIYTDPASLAAISVIQGVLVGIFIAFFTINYGMNQALKLQRKLYQQSLIDGLTGIANRRFFEECIDKEWKRAQRNKKPVSLILLDIDAFKAFNDQYGHPAGDECLQKVAKALEKTLKRPADMVARFGGEEFAVILPDTEHKGAAVLAEKVRKAIEDLNIPHSYSPVHSSVTISLGIATMTPEKNEVAETLIHFADKALYRAKLKGRNRVESTLE